MAELRELVAKRGDSEQIWSVDVGKVNTTTSDLTVNNPNRIEVEDERTPAEIIAEIEELDRQAADALQRIKELL